MIDVAKLPQVAPDFDLEQLFEAGCHFGHQSRRWHPKMKPWIYVEKDGIHIFDLAKTAEQMKHAYNYAYDLAKHGKTIVFVGTKRQARPIVKDAAERAGMYYINSRWLGGLLTNWDQVRNSLKRMVELEEGLATGKFNNYTKYERLQMGKEANRLNRFFGGLRGIDRRPDAIFIIDPSREKVAVKEAIVMGVPMVGMVDSNSDPRPIDLVIPANDDAVKSIELVINAVVSGYTEGKKNK